MKILALDTGKSQTAFAHIELQKTAHLTKLGILRSISDLSPEHIQQSVDTFNQDLLEQITSVDLVVFERVLQRPGRTSGSSVEYIGTSVGVLLARCQDVKLNVIPTLSSVWKTYLRKIQPWVTSSEIFGFPELVKTRKSNIIADHEFDACGIALWYMLRHLNMPLDDTLPYLKTDLSEIASVRKAQHDYEQQEKQHNTRNVVTAKRTKRQGTPGSKQSACRRK